MKVQPPHITDEPLLSQLKKIGIEVGKSFDMSKLDPAVQKALESAPQDAQKLMAWKLPTLARVVNGWAMNTDTVGVYGNFYLKRAILAQQGLGANVPEDAIYPMNLADSEGKLLDGTNKYTITFEKNAMPPVNAFWGRWTSTSRMRIPERTRKRTGCLRPRSRSMCLCGCTRQSPTR